MQNNRPRSSYTEARIRKCCVKWLQWTFVAETATSAKFGGACNQLHVDEKMEVFVNGEKIQTRELVQIHNPGSDAVALTFFR